MFFLGLGDLPLTDPDETFYAQTAREMLSRGEWVTPYLYGKPQFEKPVLFYWLVESSFKVFGVNEFAARLPSAVCGTLGVIAIFFFGRLFFNNRVGFLSAIILATNVEYVVLSRACITDMALFLFMLSASLFFLLGYFRERGHYYILSAASMGLAVLTKGPIFLALFLGIVLAFLILARDLKAILKMPVWQSVLVFAVITAPWYLTIHNLHGKAFIDGFFGFHNVNRFLVSEHKIGSQVYYNVPILFGGLFPWSVFIPAGLWNIAGKIRRGDKASLFLAISFVAIFSFFTVSSTKLPTYIFPSFFAIVVFLAVLADDFLAGALPAAVRRAFNISYYLLAAVMLSGWIGGAIYAKLDYPSITVGVIISGLTIALGGAASLAFFIKKRYALALLLIAVSVAAFLIPLSMTVLPEIERYEASKEVSAELMKMMKPGDPLGSESNHLAGLAYYTGKYPVDLDKHHVEVAFLNSDRRVWAVIKEKNHKQLYDPVVNPEYVKPTYSVYKLGKRSIVTNMPPEDGRYIARLERP